MLRNETQYEPRFPRRQVREENSTLWDYSGCVNPILLSRDDIWMVNTTVTDVTLVTSGSYNRLFIFPITASRWNGPITFVIHIKEEELSSFESFIAKESMLCENRITLLAYISAIDSFYHENYPINTLRNFGIHHTRSTHYVYLDIDMWPSQYSYEKLKELVDVCDDTTAVIIPAFFHTGWTIANGTFEEQVQSVSSRIPFSLSNLVSCVRAKKCCQFKKGVFTHYYIKGNWISSHILHKPKRYFEMHCWPNRFQEPYVMVKRRDNITDYLEDLINYGFNKITYIENLRYRGYRFIIAGEMFAFDLPHHPSIFNAIHKRYVYNANLPAYHSYMNIVRKHTNSSMLVLCDSLKNRTNV
ncbi:hypothetical protein WA171_002285 [Blastocystis sp. BT1]